MSDVSQGPGWWQATDGKWYPPRWEYRWAHGELRGKKHLSNIEDALAELGRQGWEAVGVVAAAAATELRSESVSVLLKRPLLS